MNLKRTFGLLVTEMLHFPVKMLTKYAPNPFIRQNTLITGVILRSNQNNKLFVLRQAKFRCLSHKLMMMFSDQSSESFEEFIRPNQKKEIHTQRENLS
jgi:hypothetical protein